MLARMSSLTLGMAQIKCGALPPAGPYVQHLHYTLRGWEFLVQVAVYRLHVGTFLKNVILAGKTATIVRLRQGGVKSVSVVVPLRRQQPTAASMAFRGLGELRIPMLANTLR